MVRFREGQIRASQGAAELGLRVRRFYQLYSSYLKAVAQRKSDRWSPGTSGGNRRKPWSKEAQDKTCHLLKDGCSFRIMIVSPQGQQGNPIFWFPDSYSEKRTLCDGRGSANLFAQPQG
jgi:hypothetical protein